MHRQHLLDVATFLTFSPELVSAATVITSMAGLSGFLKCFPIHVGKHQDFTRLGILGNHGVDITTNGKRNGDDPCAGQTLEIDARVHPDRTAAACVAHARSRSAWAPA